MGSWLLEETLAPAYETRGRVSWDPAERKTVPAISAQLGTAVTP